MSVKLITGKKVDCLSQRAYPVRLRFENGHIISIENIPEPEKNTHLPYILPGFVDAHVHIESSMLVPAGFARLAVVHGTVATVSDPHEIANVCGMEGIEFMIRNGQQVPFRFYFGAPSCVPATVFETTGATLDSRDVTALLERTDIKYLSEMMNFPGALHGDPEVREKIAAAHRLGKPVDGHAPGLRGEDARRYAGLGISTDHECFTLDEALEKIHYGMHILIREGSAARNFDALAPLIDLHPDRVMFCSDDKHPDSLADGHINDLCVRAVDMGMNPYNVIRAACINPVLHYGLEHGQLRPGDPADFILVDDLRQFRVRETWIGGELVARDGESLIEHNETNSPVTYPNRFDCSLREPGDFRIMATGRDPYHLPAIEALDGQIITGRTNAAPRLEDGCWLPDPENDLLKIVVVNRYRDAPVAKAFIRNFGLKQGALASSVAHDSHNIVAVGVDDDHICRSVNGVIRHRGGISCVKDNLDMVLPLPVAGLMSAEDGYRVAARYTLIDKAAKDAGCSLRAPFMTLSFMALLVIPHLKLSDLGLFDGDRFAFVE